GDHTRMFEADLPEIGVQPVGHESERSEWLLPANLCDVLPQLLLALAGIPRGALGFDDRNDVPRGFVQRIVGKPIPWGWVVPDNRNLKSDMGAVSDVPVGGGELRVDPLGAGLRLA